MNYDFECAVKTTKKVFQTQFWQPDSRVGRKKFWHYVSIIFGLSIIVSIISTVFGLIPVIGSIVSLVLSLAMLVTLPPSIGLAIRRMHDIGKPWFFALIPLYNLYLAAQPGEPVANAYGEPPVSTDFA